jgi:uncharacterized protein (DUF983 family)
LGTLPWKAVAALAAREVALRLHAETPAFAQSASGDWGCPACGAAALVVPAQAGHSRCRSCGKRMSNIDLAAEVLHRPEHEACLWIARAFGLIGDLPWQQVNELAGALVAECLVRHGYGLKPAREKLKWRCPLGCGSSDAFHTFRQPRRRSKCYSCREAIKNVDLVVRLRGGTPADACTWLAAQFGITLPPSAPPGAGGAVPPPPPLPPPKPQGASERAKAETRDGLWEEVRSGGGALPPAVYQDLLDQTRLTAQGARYLAGRGFPPEPAALKGFRSVDGPGDWARLRRHLQGTYTERQLYVAGFPIERGRAKVPFGGIVPMLLIPYWYRGDLISVRWRTIGPPPTGRLRRTFVWDAKRNRYRSQAGPHAQPPLPYNADALSRSVVHWIEGDFNAETLLLPQYDQNASGFPGVDVWDDAWLEPVGGAFRVVIWYDDDPAGRAARARVEQKFAARYGEIWVRMRLRHVHTPAGMDANALHCENRLLPIVRSAPWMDTSPEPIYA